MIDKTNKMNDLLTDLENAKTDLNYSDNIQRKLTEAKISADKEIQDYKVQV